MIKFCKKCLYSSLHPLGITFDKNEICSGCLIHEEKNQLDWKYRLNKLKKIVKNYKSKKSNYDCVVSIDNPDSYYILHVVKNILKLNPLTVSYNKYFNTEIGIKNQANLRIKFDTDVLFKNVNIESVKKITRYTFQNYGNIYWPILAGTSVFPVEIAVKYKIPLIIWGAHQGIEQVGMFSHTHEVEMSRRHRFEHDLFSVGPRSLAAFDNILSEDDIKNYTYPDDEIINKIGVRGIYLSNYIRWDPSAQHRLMIKLYGFQSAKLSRTFDTYDHIGCYNYMNLHDYLKYLKHGYSKVTDHACREIRHKRIKRDHAIKIVNYYQHKSVNYLNLFSKWISMSLESIKYIAQKHKNSKIIKNYKNFYKNELKFNKTSKIKKKTNIFITKNFRITSSINLNKKNEYIIFGKGYD